MGNTNSMCESIFGEGLDIRRSSLNTKYTAEQRNADDLGKLITL